MSRQTHGRARGPWCSADSDTRIQPSARLGRRLGWYHPPMDSMNFAFPLMIGLLSAVQVVWYIGVMVFLYLIWQKVRHLPS